MTNTVPLVWEQNIKITLLFQNVVVHVTLSLHSSTTCVFVFVGFCFQFYWFAHHISRLRVHPVYSDRLQAGWSVSIHRLVAHCHVQKDFDPIILPSNGDFRLSQRIIVDHSHVTKAQMMNAMELNLHASHPHLWHRDTNRDNFPQNSVRLKNA